MPRGGLIGPIHAITVMEAGATLRQVGVPGLIGPFLQPNPVGFFRSIRPIEQAQLHRRGIFRKESEIDPLPVPRGSQRIGSARPYLHHLSISIIG